MPGCRITGFVHDLHWRDLPEPVRRQTVRCLLDTLGTAIAGRRTPLSKVIHDFVVEVYGGTGARLWQDGRFVSPPGAALANGMTIDAVDMHDGHSLTKGHAGAAVVPAAVAVLGLPGGGITGAEFLTMLAVGYEIALRAGIALHATAADYHSSGAWNALGCAALAARRLKLSADQTLHALGIAEYHGPRSPMMRCVDHPTMLKDGSGWGAMTGVSAAMLAGRGFTGRPAATIESGDAARFWTDLGDRWELMRQYFKPQAVCRWAQPAVEGALRLRAEQGLAPDDIAAIRVRTFHEAARLAVRVPATTEEAQYSLPFPVAVALVHGTVDPDRLIGAALDDEAVVRLARLVDVQEDPLLSRQFPARRLAHVTIYTHAGGCFEVDGVEPRWDAGAPPSDHELIAKFRRLTGSLPPSASAELENTILGCPHLTDASLLAERLADLGGS